MSRARVLVVDDSVVIRKVVSDCLGADPEIEVVGIAANGRIALAKLAHVAVDVIVLDVEMPEMDGLEVLRELRHRPSSPRVIMFSSHTTEQAKATVEALALGAADCVAKPSSLAGSAAAQSAALQSLVDRVRALGQPRRSIVRAPSPSEPRALPAPAVSPARPLEVVAIGASTGGPNALCQLFASLPGNFPVPIVLVQHMPAGFTKPFAERLTRESKLLVEEGYEGGKLSAGRAWLAPGGRHMVVRRTAAGLQLHLHDSPPVWSCRPAVDVLFQSVVETCGRGTLGVVMTGMGEDGKLGALAIRRAGGAVIVQDEQSSVVWGMAGAVANAGLAEAILPLDQLAEAIVRRVRSKESA